jgi:CRP-like cAMP-binding protein
MHATASALVGIALGRLRRASSAEKLGGPIIGIGLAVVIHVTYNNVVARLNGPLLLLVAIGLGFVGFVLIFFLISQGLAEEKKHFAQTLGLNVGVSASERRAVQQLGGDAIEQILKELAEFFGEDKIAKIRRLLVIQANIGILQNNLSSQVSDRLRKAWQEEIKTLRAENNQLRHSLGLYVMSFLRGVFPENDEDWSDSISQQIRTSDPTQIHSFDIFMRVSEAAKTVTAEELERTAGILQRAEIFKDLSPADLENLSRAVTTHTFQAGEALFNEGDEGDTLYMIRQGQINLFRRDQSGEERLLGTCGVGDVVGELALLDGYPRSAQARAADHVVALRLRREHFMMFIQSRPQVMIAVLRFLADRVRNTTHALEATTAWATSVAQGNYREARDLGVLANAAEIAAPDLSAKPSEVINQPEPQSLSSTGTMRLGGAFSKIAVALEQREKILVSESESTGHHLLEIDDMPETHKRVINLLLHDPIAASRGLAQDVLRSKLDDMEGLPIILEELDKNGWLIIVGEPPDTRYKVNLHRRRGRTLDSQRAWTKLDKDYE